MLCARSVCAVPRHLVSWLGTVKPMRDKARLRSSIVRE